VSARPTAEGIRELIGFVPEGAPAGNVTIGRGALEGHTVRCALVENRAASGALGVAECTKLGALFDELAARPEPLLLFLDSAGAKVSEGLPALGAFRRLFASGLACALAGTPMAAVLGTNCFGGASMLAHLAGARLFGPHTRLAMSGPAILATSAGISATDEMFRAMADATIGAAGRAKASAANTAWHEELDIAQWLAHALRPSPRSALAGWLERHRLLGERLPPEARSAGGSRGLERAALDALFPQGWNADEADGVLTGEGEGAHGREAIIGLVRRAPLGAAAAWRFADSAWRLGRSSAARVRVLLDCATHAAGLDDERIVLSEFIVDMADALAVLARQSTLELVVTGEAGGGVYVALAGPAPVVSALAGAAVIRVLPQAAIAAILGADREAAPEADAYVRSGVADHELRLGVIRNSTT